MRVQYFPLLFQFLLFFQIGDLQYGGAIGVKKEKKVN
jgi:hypothetical protein